MEKRILDYYKYMEEQLEKLQSGALSCEIETLKKEHLVQVGLFQHERLIHLIVTITFALLEAISVLMVLISGESLTILLPVVIMILLIPYVRHYYILENTVQSMYEQYDRLNQWSEEKKEEKIYFKGSR